MRKPRSENSTAGPKRVPVRLVWSGWTPGGAASLVSSQTFGSSNRRAPLNARPELPSKRGRLRNRVVLAVVGATMGFAPRPCWAEDAPKTGEATAVAKAEREPFSPPLEPLPDPPSRQFREPNSEDQALLEQLLSKFTGGSEAERQSAVAEVTSISESLVPAIYARINLEAQGADRGAMKQLLLDIRHQTRERLERESHGGKVETPDYLQMVIAEPRLDSGDWKRLARVLALSRMCVGIGTVDAVRALTQVFVRFEFLRIDTQLQLAKLGDQALAALIETTRHQAPQVSEWAKQQLDYLGKAIPSEAVRVTSPETLADILRAYGYTKDPDAARLTLSFTSSERSQVRLAARQAIRSYGATAIWVLRDAYEQTVGTKPSSQWGWDRVARELFREYDRNRLVEVYEYYERGLRLLDEAKVDEALAQFEALLRRSPDFRPNDRMVAAILDFAQQDPEGRKDWERVERLLQTAARLGSEEQSRSARSLLATVQARRLAARGFADQFVLRQALDLRPENAQAQRLLAELQQPALQHRSGFHRWLWPTVLGALSLVFTAILLRNRRSPST